MSEKKKSIFSKILKPKTSSCCSMQIVEEPDQTKNQKKEQSQNKEA